MNLSFLIELVVVLSVGLGFARWHVTDPAYAGVYASRPSSYWLRQAGGSFFAGAALVGCACVWLERTRRHGPTPWGPGRWAWASVGLYLLIKQADSLVNAAVRSFRYNVPFSDFLKGIPAEARANLGHWFLNFMPSMLLALGVVYLVNRPQSPSPPDAREWSGRILAALVITSGIAVNLAGAAGF